MKVIKSYAYNVVSTDPFDMPLPLEFSLMSGNTLLATYHIHENGRIDYEYNASAKERILTSTVRPLELNDIYFLFSSRVFPDRTLFTRFELERFGLDEYNTYEIARKTHGIMPIDRYWFRFSDEGDMSYKQVMKNFSEYFLPKSAAPEPPKPEKKPEPEPSGTIMSLEAIMEQKSNEYTVINDVGSILNESKLDVQSLAANIDDAPITESAFARGHKANKSGADGSQNHEQTAALPEEVAESGYEPLSQETPEEPAASAESGGNLSPEAIAAMLADADAPEPETAAVPEAETEPSGDEGRRSLSPEEIDALLWNVSESDVETVKSAKPQTKESGGNMSPEDIAALLNKS